MSTEVVSYFPMNMFRVYGDKSIPHGSQLCCALYYGKPTKTPIFRHETNSAYCSMYCNKHYKWIAVTFYGTVVNTNCRIASSLSIPIAQAN